MRDAIFTAKPHHRRRAGYAQFRLQRSRLVINAGMNDAAIVAALVTAHTGFFLQQQQVSPGKSPRDFKPHRQPDNPSANDDDVVT